MIIGHLPAGYIFSKLLAKKLAGTAVNVRHIVFVGIVGAVIADLDMFYFHLVDNRQHHHHTYWPHYPIVWAGLLAASFIWYRVASEKSNAILAVVFSVAGFIHLLLDSIVGDVWWFAPFVDKSYALFTVPALYQPWWLNFILHWSFALELFLVAWAFLLWRGTKVFNK